MEHDTPEEINARAANQKEFDLLIQELRKKIPADSATVTETEVPDTRPMDNTLRRSNSRAELVEKFKAFLAKRPAKGKALPLKENTRKQYELGVFGLSHSFERTLKEIRGEATEMHHLMFRPNNLYIKMDIGIVEEFLRVKEDVGAGTNLGGASGLIQLCTYFGRAATMDPDYHPSNRDHQLYLMQFRENMREIAELLKLQIPVLSTLASEQAAARKEKEARADPEQQQQIRSAILGYYKSGTSSPIWTSFTLWRAIVT